MRHHDQAPRQVTDVLLWRLAHQVAAAHQSDPARPGRCGNLGCHGAAWPCPARRLATHAERASLTRPPPRIPRHHG
jgi:hypothetical protein